MSQERLERMLFVISDSTGETASRAGKVALEQFFNVDIQEKRYPFVQSEEEVVRYFRLAAAQNAFVVYTLVNNELRARAHTLAEELAIHAIDILGELLARMALWLDREPHQEAGHVLDAAYFKRIAAIDFAQKNDDGKRPHNLPRADIVVVGPSRSSKTPVSHDLARKGYRTANVPLFLEGQPPRELSEVESGRVFALFMQPERLQAVRKERLPALGMSRDSSYVQLEYIERELAMIRELVRANRGWTLIDTTNRAIEEISAQIMHRYQKRFNGN